MRNTIAQMKINLLKVLDKYQLNGTSIFMIPKKRVCLFPLLGSEGAVRPADHCPTPKDKECAISVDIFLFSKVRGVGQTKPFYSDANMLCQLNENRFNEKCQFILRSRHRHTPEKRRGEEKAKGKMKEAEVYFSPVCS